MRKRENQNLCHKIVVVHFIGSFLYSNQNVGLLLKKRGAIVIGSDCCDVFAVLPCWGGRTGSVHRGKFLLHTVTWAQNTLKFSPLLLLFFFSSEF